MTPTEHRLEEKYAKILSLANKEKAISEGQTFDLMYVNGSSEIFSPQTEYAFMRKYHNEVLFIVVNFADSEPIAK